MYFNDDFTKQTPLEYIKYDIQSDWAPGYLLSVYSNLLLNLAFVARSQISHFWVPLLK